MKLITAKLTNTGRKFWVCPEQKKGDLSHTTVQWVVPDTLANEKKQYLRDLAQEIGVQVAKGDNRQTIVAKIAAFQNAI